MKKKSNLLLLMIAVIIFVSGCNGNGPSVDFKIDKNSIDLDDNSISSEFVTATVTRSDDENVSMVIVMKFFPEKPEYIYPVDSEGNKIDELSTKPLNGQGAKDTLQFKVFGNKRGYTTAESQIKIELWWNNTKLEGMDRILEVIVE